jgi:ankyrin repeat protein
MIKIRNSESSVDIINSFDEYRNTPLFYACLLGNNKVVSRLLDAGADSSIECGKDKKYTPFTVSVAYNREKIYMDILQRCKNSAKKSGNDLSGAFFKMYLDFIIYHKPNMLAKMSAADVKLCDESGRSLLFYACFNDKLKAVKLLLSKKSALNIPEETHGRTEAHAVAYAGSVSTLQCLQNAGTNFSHKDKYGVTPLMISARHCNLECLQFILKVEDIFAIDNNGKTVFSHAIDGQSVSIIYFLLLFLRIHFHDSIQNILKLSLEYAKNKLSVISGEDERGQMSKIISAIECSLCINNTLGTEI